MSTTFQGGERPGPQGRRFATPEAAAAQERPPRRTLLLAAALALVGLGSAGASVYLFILPAALPPPRLPAAPPLPAVPAPAAPVLAPQAPAPRPTAAPPPAALSPRPDELFAGRTAAWWRQRLASLEEGSAPGALELRAVTRQRAVASGLLVTGEGSSLQVAPRGDAGASR
ncbi:MAG: hypothetical protein HZB56_10055 [Deltaproteobacteria bacterium]|nr:hypothetical protein [Deltaproteobacteria bacterium]